LSLGKFSVMQV